MFYLKQTGSSAERLKSGANGGQEGSNLDDLGVRPGNITDHKTPANALAEPG